MLGTISDMVPLIDENRLIVSIGLKNLKNTKSIGLKIFLKKEKKQNLTILSCIFNNSNGK